MCTDAARPPRASKAPQTYGAPRETPFSSEGSPFDDLTAFAAHQLWAGTNGALRRSMMHQVRMLEYYPVTGPRKRSDAVQLAQTFNSSCQRSA